jgi:hypothetical protein
MIEGANGSTSLINQKKSQPVFRMESNHRMGGSMPVWDEAGSARAKTSSRLANALADPGIKGSPFQMTLAAQKGAEFTYNEAKPFGFGDLVDMVNPLHHLPIVGTLYREVTGDEIRGAGKVIGGAVFGGAAGAGSSLVNLVVEHETGEDIQGKVMSFAREKVLSNEAEPASQHPQSRLNAALEAYEKAPREPITKVNF